MPSAFSGKKIDNLLPEITATYMNIKKFIYLLAMIVSVQHISCSKADSDTEQAAALAFLQAELVSSATGGTAFSGKEARLSIPAGALEEDTNITVERIAAPSPQENIVPFQAAYSFGPEELQFAVPARLEICYSAQELISRNLQEETVQIFYQNPHNGELTSVGGEVDPVNHCVTTEIEHFSTYLVAAISLATGNNPPVIGGGNLLPATPVIGMPLRISTTVTDFSTDGTGAISSVYLHYRRGTTGSFTKVAMNPDPYNTGAQTYYYTIPHTQVLKGTLQYYIEATDNLGARRMRPSAGPAAPSSVSISTNAHATTPLRITPTTSPLNMAAGFSRVFTTQVRRSTGTYMNIAPDSYDVTGGIGTAAINGASSLIFTSQNSGIGSLQVSVGPASVSRTINVSAGQLHKIEILDVSKAIISSPVSIKAGQSYEFDVLGYDIHGNTMVVLASLTLTPGIGTIATDGTFTASPIFPQSGTLTATFDGFTDVIDVLITDPATIVATPSFSPVAGTYAEDLMVTIGTTTEGATIYFTTDGSDPTTTDSIYTTPIPVSGHGTNMTVKALAVKPGLENSTASASYSIVYNTVATPEISPLSGVYLPGIAISITTTTPGASIHYTTDGSMPTPASPLYVTPLHMADTMTVKAIAVKSGMLNSAVASSDFTPDFAICGDGYLTQPETCDDSGVTSGDGCSAVCQIEP